MYALRIDAEVNIFTKGLETDPSAAPAIATSDHGISPEKWETA